MRRPVSQPVRAFEDPPARLCRRPSIVRRLFQDWNLCRFPYTLRDTVSASIVAYVSNESARTLASSEAADSLRRVGSLQELAQAIVENPAPCVILELAPEGGPELIFAASLTKSFPVLDGAVITDAAHPELADSPLRRFTRNELKEEPFQSCLRSRAREQLRQFQRFEWPLQAELRYDGGRSAYSVCSISAGGAYLESHAQCPPSNTTAEITVRFGNFALTAKCTVLGGRMASSNLPPGFPVRFEDLSEHCRSTIDTIVKDALLGALLNPEEEPEIPSLETDESFDDPSLSLLSM